MESKVKRIVVAKATTKRVPEQVVWETSDNRQFDSEFQAKKHEEVLEKHRAKEALLNQIKVKNAPEWLIWLLYDPDFNEDGEMEQLYYLVNAPNEECLKAFLDNHNINASKKRGEKHTTFEVFPYKEWVVIEANKRGFCRYELIYNTWKTQKDVEKKLKDEVNELPWNKSKKA